MNGFWDEMKRLGKDRNPFRAGFLQFVGVAESREAEAMELYREPAEYFYNRCLHVDARFAGAARLRERGDDPLEASQSQVRAAAATRAQRQGRVRAADLRGDRRRRAT